VLPLLAPDAQESDDIRGGAIHAAASMPHQQKDIFAAFVALNRSAAHSLSPTPHAASAPLQRRALGAPGTTRCPACIDCHREMGPIPCRKNAARVRITSKPCSSRQNSPRCSRRTKPPRSARSLKGLKVAVFVVNTLREQMKYDTTRLVRRSRQAV